MSLYELNDKAWYESKDIDCSKTIVVIGNLKWPSQEAFKKALKELYDSIKPIRSENET